MFTVILLSRAAREIFERSRVYFEPFIEAGSIAFCEWNRHPGARTLAEAAPELPEIIRGKSEWRAVVVEHPREETDRAPSLPENPFDFVENVRTELTLEDSPHAIVRLAHILLGYPHLTAKRFSPVISYLDPGTDVPEPVKLTSAELVRDWALSQPGSLHIEYAGADGEPETELSADFVDAHFAEALSAVAATKTQVRRQFEEAPYSVEERQQHSVLSERYAMKEVRPSEVIFLATRGRIEEDDSELLRRAWSDDTAHEPTRFVERNDFPPMSRFAAYDLLEPENSGYEQDEFRFWMSVLSIATNLMPASGFQADRVYGVAVEISERRLIEMLNAHLSQLATLRDHIDVLIARPRLTAELEVTELLSDVEMSVEFDEVDGSELEVAASGYGMASDTPRLELSRWREDFSALQGKTGRFLRGPRRVLVRAVDRARELAKVGRHDAVTLGEIEREEIETELLQRAGELAIPATAHILDPADVRSMLDRHDRAMTMLTTERMTARTIIAALSGVGLVWLLSFVPALVRAFQTGGAEGIDLAVVVVAGLVLLGFIGFVTLLVMRQRVRRRIAEVNHDLHRMMLTVNAGASRYADYLSKYVTYIRGRNALRSAQSTAGKTAGRMRRLRLVNERIRQRIRDEKALVLSLGGAIEVTRSTIDLFDFEPEDEARVRRMFRFEQGESLMPFNVSGERVTAPYDFVTGITLDRLAAFEPVRGQDAVA